MVELLLEAVDFGLMERFQGCSIGLLKLDKSLKFDNLWVWFGDLELEGLGVLFGVGELELELSDFVVKIVDFVFFLLGCLEVVLEFIVLFHEFIVLELT